MAFTEQELNIAKQIKEQGGTKEDFLDILKQIRTEQPTEQPIEQPVEVSQDITVGDQTITPTQDPSVLTADSIADIAVTRQAEEVEKAQEAEEGLTWFTSETKEALEQRWEQIWEIKERFDKKLQSKSNIVDVFKKEWLWEALKTSMAEELNRFGSSFQLAGQVVWAWTDVIWEWVENLLQEATPEAVENVIEWAISKITDTETVKNIAKAYAEFREKNPEIARNIEASVNMSEVLPIAKGKKILKKPFSEAIKKQVRENAEKELKNVGRAILNLPDKTSQKEAFDMTKFFAEKAKKVDDFDDLVGQFEKTWKDAINKVNNSLKSSKTLHKPAWAKEVLNVIKDNLKWKPFVTNLEKEVNGLLKKINNEWLTLSELNKIKRSINDYTKAWNASWKEAAWIAPEAMRGKYGEIKTYIENAAKREKLPDIKQLNKDWINSNALLEFLWKQANKVGKKKWLEAIQQSKLRGIWDIIFKLRKKSGLTDITDMEWLADLSLSKVIDAIKKINKKTESKTIQSKIKWLIK